MSRHRSGENLREVILDATERLLGDDPAAITARAVLEAAGVSSGTLFHYFATIDALLFAVAKRAAARQRAEFGDPAADGAEAVLARLFDLDRRDTVLPWLRQRAIGSPSLREALRRYDADVLDQFEQAVHASRRQLDIPEGLDVRAALEVVRALAEGLQLRLASETLAVEPQRAVKVALDLIVSSWLQGEHRQ